MKQKLIIILIFCVNHTFIAQEKLGKPFFTGAANLTFAINEYYTLGSDDGESLLIPTAIFLRTGFGYEIKKRVAISFNFGLDYHWNYAVSAIPTYGSLRYNITEKYNNTFFLEASYGKMWRLSQKYSNGKYYSFGIGTQTAGNGRWNTIIRLDFHRKAIIGFENNRLDSVSLGVGFSFF